MTTRREATRRGESFGTESRLHRRVDFQRCYRKGLRRHGRFAVLHAATNELGRPRLGITVSRKVGGAVVRVRTKRRIREIFRRWSKRSELPAADLVVHVKPQAASASFHEMRRDLTALMSWLARRAAPGR